MSGRLQLIEQKLKSIDGATFQNLCDTYLALRFNDLKDLNRIGSQIGKRKTVAGTPDTLLRLRDDSVRYIEYTTKADGLAGKIQSDIDSCIDPNKINSPLVGSRHVWMFHNSKLSGDEDNALFDYAKKKAVTLELYGIDRLALEINSSYPILSTFLELPVDTGQVIPIELFVQQYDNKAGGVATPLSNTFLHREDELNKLADIIANNDLILLTGSPGVGKSKLAIQALHNFRMTNTNYEILAIDNKGVDVFADLRIHLQKDKNYILFIDDVNRQLVNYKQVLGIFKEVPKGKIKLALTVREYAIKDVLDESSPFESEIFTVRKFSNEEIKLIIASEPFEIRNPKFVDKIVLLANGNARLAIMAAKLAKDIQGEFLFESIEQLYDTYFRSFKDKVDLLGDKDLFKVLGLISFFYTIDRSKKDFLSKLLLDFEVDSNKFHDAVEKLHSLELVEIRFDVVKISEQVLSTYFFYKAFMSNAVLSFDKLLREYFLEYKGRFGDTIIPVTNAFTFEEVSKAVDETLDECIKAISPNKDLLFNFFDIFWFFKRQRVLELIVRETSLIPEPINPLYNGSYKTNEFVYSNDRIVSFASYLFEHDEAMLELALQASTDYVRKKPGALPELVRRIIEKTSFKPQDEELLFKRQQSVLNVLTKTDNISTLHGVEIFVPVALSFLKHSFQIFENKTHRTLSFGDYPIPACQEIVDIRNRLWDHLYSLYDISPDKINDAVLNFRPTFPKHNQALLELDIKKIVHFIVNRGDIHDISTIHKVTELVAIFDRIQLCDRNYRNLLNLFNNASYQRLLLFSWENYRQKPIRNLEDFEEFERLKAEEIKSSFEITNEAQFDELGILIRNFILIEPDRTYDINRSISIIVENTYTLDNELGLKLLSFLMAQIPDSLWVVRPVMKLICETKKGALFLWEIIGNWKHVTKPHWLTAYFDCVPKEFCNYELRKGLFEHLESLKGNSRIRVENWFKFDVYKPESVLDRLKYKCFKKGLFSKRLYKYGDSTIGVCLEIIMSKNSSPGIRITIDDAVFDTMTGLSSRELEIYQKSYIQQSTINAHYDLDRKGFREHVRLSPDFFIRYITEFYVDHHETGTQNTKLQLIWKLNLSRTMIQNSLLKVASIGYFHNSPVESFLWEIDSETTPSALENLMHFVSVNGSNPKCISSVFDAVRKAAPQFYESLLLQYLSICSDLDSFKRIDWEGNVGVISGEDNFGDLYSARWQEVLKVVEKYPKPLEVIQIKNYIEEQIRNNEKSAENERKRKFSDPHF